MTKYEMETGQKVEEYLSGCEGEILYIDGFNEKVTVKFDEGDQCVYDTKEFCDNFSSI